jgi:rare lipoprotein A (peptidoglycan hydrolase)
MGQRDLLRGQGDAQQEGYDAMPMRRTIGISLACLVTSACAVAGTPEESTTHYPGESTGVTPGSAEMPTDRSRSFACAAAQERWPADYGSEWAAQRSMSFGPVTDACSSAPDPCFGPVRVAGTSQFGKASWYDQVGSPTASGESLDTFTATAAHRSLPLASYAKVTNLDSVRKVLQIRLSADL